MKRLRGLSWAIVPLLLSTVASAADPSNVDAYWASKGASRSRLPVAGSLPAVFVSSFDERLGTPSFVWASASSSPKPAGASVDAESAARAHFARHAVLFGVRAQAAAGLALDHVLDTGRGGVIARFHQTAGGIEIFHRDVKVMMNRSLDAIALAGVVHPELGETQRASFAKSDADAIVAAYQDLFGLTLAKDKLAPIASKSDGGYRFFETKGASSVRLSAPIRVKRVFFALPERLVPAYFLELLGKKDQDDRAYAYVIAADDGRLLYRENLTHKATFDYRVWADATGDKRPHDGPLADFTPHPTGQPDGSYPAPTAPVLVSMDGFDKNADPWLPSGAMEANGNNVDAYTDDDNPDGFSPGDVRASVTAPGTFDRTYDLTQDPQASTDQKMAAVTQLFYVTNWLHDYWYDSGFDEKGGNAQASNYGRGGVEGDVMHAEGQDGAPGKKDNANMSVPADGTSPRMQMYVWSAPSSSSLTVTPGGALVNGTADFGPQTFNQMGNVVLANDGQGTVTDACEPITNNVSGSIVLVDRGTCTFKQKAVNAQAAGATGMILANNQANQPPPQMPDANPAGTINIPVLSITLADGTAMKAALMNGNVSATMTRTGSVLRDGTIDGSVIAHEWGHYLHLRHVACGVPICQGESEGWADFNALHMVVRQGDDLGAVFPLAQYAVAAQPDDPGYFGIRRYPYSIDMSKNPLTFKDITSGQMLPAGPPVAQSVAANDNTEPHNTGEVWAAMLFEGYVALLKNATGANPPYTFDEARRRMADYVVGGLTLAPADPTFLEQRDAILATALAADPNDFLLLAQAFARRGAGTCAVAPPRDSTDFSGVVESFETKPTPVIVSTKVDDAILSCDHDGVLDAGEQGNVTVHVMNGGTAKLTGATLTLSTKTAGVTFTSGAMTKLPDIDPLAAIDVKVPIALDGTITKQETMDLTVSIDAAGACTMTTTSTTAPRVNYDEVPMSSTTDTVEASTSAWTIGGDGAKDIWTIQEVSPGEHAWTGSDHSSPSDTWLVSPELDVDPAAAFSMKFDQRHSFEQSMNTNWDGGVIEVSVDGGKNWNDASMYGMVPYEGQIGDPQNQAVNTLKGRQGFVGQNPSWPMRDPIAVDFAKSLAGKKVQVRFRIGTDDAKGDIGWEIDNIAFSGITNKPFASIVDDMTDCNGMPDGGTTTGTSMTTSSSGNVGATTGSSTTSSGMGGAGTSSGGAVHTIDQGCGCFLAGDAATDWRALGLAGLAAAALVRRRRARR